MEEKHFKSCFIDKVNKIGKHLDNIAKKKGKTEITNIRK